MAAITSENTAVAMARLIAAEILPALAPRLFMTMLVNRNYEPVLANAGASVDIPIAPTLVANNIAETGSISTQNPGLGNATVTLTSHIESSFAIPDINKALSSVDILRAYMQPATLAIATRLETDLLSLYPMFTYNTAVGASATAPTEQVIDDAENALFKAYIDPNTEKYCACSADFFASLRQIPRFTEVATIGSGDAIITGQFGKLKNISFFRSQLVQAVTGTTNNLAFTRDAIALVTRKMPTADSGLGAIQVYAEMYGIGMRITMSYTHSTLSETVTVDMLYGAAAVRNQAAVIINS